MEVLKVAAREAHASAPERLYVLHAPPDRRAIALVVYAPPFAEEMNKSRRMVAEQARSFADAGIATLLVDPLGCGDSDGEFSDASWERWVDDVADACHWLRARVDGAGLPFWLWGLRSGCLLTDRAAATLEWPSLRLMWQPVRSGKQALQQFLRLKSAAGLGDGRRPGTADLVRQLAGGEPVDVAGYRVSPSLAAGLESATLAPPDRPTHAVMLEVQSQAGAAPSPGFATLSQQWVAAGHTVQAGNVVGASFWQTAEIEEVPELVELTTRLVGEISARPSPAH